MVFFIWTDKNVYHLHHLNYLTEFNLKFSLLILINYKWKYLEKIILDFHIGTHNYVIICFYFYANKIINIKYI